MAMSTTIRRLVALAALVAAGAGFALSPAGAVSNPSLGKWFPNATAQCTGTCSGVSYFLARASDPKDRDGLGYNTFGCNFVNNGSLCTLDFNWPAKQPLAAPIPAGSVVSGTVYVSTDLPDSINGIATLASQTATGKTFPAAGTATTASAASSRGVYVPLTFKFTTTKDIPAGRLLDFDFQVNCTAGFAFVGYAKPHQSVFTIG